MFDNFNTILLSLSVTAFRTLRKSKQSQLIVGLSFNLIFLLSGLLSGLERTENSGVCFAVALLLHYFLLSSFCWMALMAFFVYLKVFVVFPDFAKRYMLKCSLLAQGNAI